MGWEARLRPHREGDACDSQASVPLLPRGLWSWMRRGEEGHAGIVAVMVKLREAKGTSQGLALAELRGCRELQPRRAHGLDGQGLVSYSMSMRTSTTPVSHGLGQSACLVTPSRW